MAWLTSILTWIAGQVLRYLLGLVTDQVIKKAEEVKRDQERGEINEANVKAYEESNDRLDRIKRAGELLNRVRVP